MAHQYLIPSDKKGYDFEVINASTYLDGDEELALLAEWRGTHIPTKHYSAKKLKTITQGKLDLLEPQLKRMKKAKKGLEEIVKAINEPQRGFYDIN